MLDAPADVDGPRLHILVVLQARAVQRLRDLLVRLAPVLVDMPALDAEVRRMAITPVVAPTVGVILSPCLLVVFFSQMVGTFAAWACTAARALASALALAAASASLLRVCWGAGLRPALAGSTFCPCRSVSITRRRGLCGAG